MDGTKITKISELYLLLKVVYFSPNDIEIAQGAPSVRRNFIDLAISQQNYNYLLLLKEYQQILKQRNALLKTEFNKDEKRTWDKRFIHKGAKIIETRIDYLRSFSKLLTENYNFISGENEVVNAEYVCSAPLNPHDSLKDRLTDHLDTIETQENHAQRSLFGPHLDDILFKINEKSFRYFGSQGQKRSLVISAGLAQAKMIDAVSSEFPVLIFDDVLSELDENRTKNIIELLSTTHQIFIATPNASQYSFIDLPTINMENLSN
jgi:DNA replication and repair protein RecF